jgi:hypothetical protein
VYNQLSGSWQLRGPVKTHYRVSMKNTIKYQWLWDRQAKLKKRIPVYPVFFFRSIPKPFFFSGHGMDKITYNKLLMISSRRSENHERKIQQEKEYRKNIFVSKYLEEYGVEYE